MAEQTWPLFWNAPQKSLLAMAAGSTSSSTMAASLPPSSRVTRLRSGAAEAATCLPVATDPVKEILAGTGCEVIHAPSSSPPLTTLRVDSGVKGDGLRTMVLPASSAGAIFHEARMRGKFHGVMAATTPSGRR